ncbi:MAG TPA: hypothetical protein VLG71_03300 [Candidatus Limnocylindria bacterium]|nr:hypothetical protein [Candidatus Limnocylindria bacterium]
MMKHSPLMKFVCLFSWVVTGLVAVAVGARAFGHDFMMWLSMQSYAMPALYVILACGVLSLLAMVKMLAMGCSCSCGAEHKH